jgi:hypothetical protein
MGPVCKAKAEAERWIGDDPCTMTDPLLAAATLRALRTRILATADRRVVCGCGEPLKKAALAAFDHEGGMRLAGFATPQWIVFRCAKCGYEMAAWKVSGRIDLAGLEPPMEESA